VKDNYCQTAKRIDLNLFGKIRFTESRAAFQIRLEGRPEAKIRKEI